MKIDKKEEEFNNGNGRNMKEILIFQNGHPEENISILDDQFDTEKEAENFLIHAASENSEYLILPYYKKNQF